MKIASLGVLLVGLMLSTTAAHGAEPQTLRNAGVLGNSGEQRDTLVRFGKSPTPGLGVVMDRHGALWDRGGEERLNRYAPDGRLLGAWKLPPFKKSHHRDGIVLFGDLLLIKQGRQLYTLPIDASPDAEPKLLPVEATVLSCSTHHGWAAAALEKEVFLVNAAGETRPVAALDESPFAVELGPDGGVYVHVQLERGGKQGVRRVDDAAPADARGPWTAPGGKLQWLTGHWFGQDHHGTVRRFSPDFEPAPGVVLGGNSGSFIGYVPGNYELTHGAGLAHLGGNLYAVSGAAGVLHLLEWSPTELRFEIIRRIGAVPYCEAIGLDSRGRIWQHSGVWQWTDAPDAPLQHGVPAPDAPGPFAIAMTEDDQMFAATRQGANGMFYAGPFDGPVERYNVGDRLPTESVAGALVKWNGRPAMLLVNAAGQGRAIFAGRGNNESREIAGDAALQTQQPLQKLTTLAALPDNGVLAAADGHLVHFAAGDNNTWRETKRWNRWGQGDAAQFGGELYAAVSQGRLWAADVERHRVLCFDLSGDEPKLLASFGVADQAGDDLAALHAPRAIAANGSRAVVYDSGNQRLVRLELE